jgi:hypothetical protein
MSDIKFAHTNIIARGWKKLVQFYIDIFECEPAYPERDLEGDWFGKVTSIPDVRVRGIHS